MSLRRTCQIAVALLIGGVLLSFGVSAGAVDNPDYTSPPPSTVVTTPPPATQVVTAVPANPLRSSLAITGASTGAEAAVAVGLIVVGSGALVLRRRLRSAAS